MTNLVIASTQIRQLDGLFNLNDLHKASGGEEKHQPNKFLRLKQTKELIKEISNWTDLSNSNYPDMGNLDSKCSDVRIYSPVKTQKGANGGTFVCKQLTIAYAAWINAKIHLETINAFLEKHDPDTKPDDDLITLHKSVLNKTGAAIVTIEDGMQTAKPVERPNQTSKLDSNYTTIVTIVHNTSGENETKTYPEPVIVTPLTEWLPFVDKYTQLEKAANKLIKNSAAKANWKQLGKIAKLEQAS